VSCLVLNGHAVQGRWLLGHLPSIGDPGVWPVARRTWELVVVSCLVLNGHAVQGRWLLGHLPSIGDPGVWPVARRI
jgi:hypothetical protein